MGAGSVGVCPANLGGERNESKAKLGGFVRESLGTLPTGTETAVGGEVHSGR
jgi:hypothetical protein